MSICRNVGPADRAARLVIALIALTLAFTSLGVTEARPLGLLAAAVGIIMLLTAAMAVCPLYIPLGLSTRVTRPR